MSAQATIRPPAQAGVPPDTLIAAFDCFYFEARPGGKIMMRIVGPEGGSVDIILNNDSALTLEGVLRAARARINTPPLPALASQAAPAPRPPQPETPAAVTQEDRGSIDEPAHEVHDAGEIAGPDPLKPTLQ